jgi:hypothetical protein
MQQISPKTLPETKEVTALGSGTKSGAQKQAQ